MKKKPNKQKKMAEEKKMERFKFKELLGEAYSGIMWKAEDVECKKTVAVKELTRDHFSKDHALRNPEVDVWTQLEHPNIIKITDIISLEDTTCLILEHTDDTLQGLLKKGLVKVTEATIQKLMHDLLEGLNYMHKKKIVHGDLRPESLLVCGGMLKIGDLGRSPWRNKGRRMWYAAPEIISSSINGLITREDAPSDMWSVGAIMAELFKGRVLFRGKNDRDQLHKIYAVLGTRNSTAPLDLSEVIPNACKEAIDLMKELLQHNPYKRPSAEECLQHPFFKKKFEEEEHEPPIETGWRAALHILLKAPLLCSGVPWN